MSSIPHNSVTFLHNSMTFLHNSVTFLHNSATFLRILTAVLVQKWTEACTGSLEPCIQYACFPHITRSG